jgi:hypothetical protein
VALICPAVNKLAPVTLPLELIAPEFKLVNVPTEVMLACAAVVKLPVKLVALTLPPVMLPVAVIEPAVRILPPVMLPVADTVLVDVNSCESPITVLPLILIAILVLLFYELG